MNYKVSVIVPVYNVEKYLDETINSVINQNIDFEKNVELILVNDGSSDNSEKICLKYKEKYPNNIKYIYKENSGVSDTRNLGYKESNGKYIMFLDSDDLINNSSLRLTSKFLDKHNEVDFVISRVRFFDAMNKWHYLDFRFKSHKKIVDINFDIKYCQYHSTGILIRSEALKNVKFDKNVKYGEDMKFMAELLFNNGKFGIEKNSILYYRKRKEETSAVQTQFKNKSYYINTMRDSFKYILDESKKRYGEIPLYFKHFIMNSLCERLLLKDPEYDVNKVLTDKEFQEYISCFKSMLEEFDDELILNQDRLSINHKYYLMKLLHGEKYKIERSLNNDKAKFNDIEFPLRRSDICKIIDLKKEKNNIIFNMCINDYVFDVDIMCNGEKINAKPLNKVNKEDAPESYYDINFKKLFKDKIYEVSYDINNFKKLEIKSGNNNAVIYVMDEVVKHNALPYLYKKIGKKLIVFKENEVISKDKFVRIYTLLYKFMNVIYIIKRDGLVMTIKRSKGVLNG